MASEEVVVKGLSDLQNVLDTFDVNVEKKIMRGALRAGTKVILTEARSNVQRITKSGALLKSLRISTRVNRRGYITSRVIAGSKKAFYALWVEFGTAAHFIAPKAAKALSFAGVFEAGVDHPGAKKSPYLRPALDTKTGAALEAFADTVRAKINVETAKQLEQLPDEVDGGSR